MLYIIEWFVCSVSFNLYQIFKADIDEHRFQTHLDGALQE